MARIAVLDKDNCKPKRCQYICMKVCPLLKTGVKVIEVGEDSKPIIHEHLCLGCGICVKKCPFKAISIVNIPEELEEECVHRYGINGFKLYRLPIPKRGKVLGIIGRNGAGKTTCLKILAGKLKPNLGVLDRNIEWDEVIAFFRGTELQTYFKMLSEGKLRTVLKIQDIGLIPKVIKGTVGKILEVADERGKLDYIKDYFDLDPIWDRELKVLSGGELQKVSIAIAYLKDADVYLFDEPSSYLDVYYRMKAARLIRKLAEEEGKTVLVVEHDLAVLDYISDYICVIYGEPGVYGVVSLPRGVGVGINEYLDGYLTSENIRIREYAIKFHLRPIERLPETTKVLVSWPNFEKKLGNFKLSAEAGEARIGEVIGLVGPNGIGKTTFIRIIAGELEADTANLSWIKESFKISYKPQYLRRDIDMPVYYFLKELGGDTIDTSWFKDEVLKPLKVDKLMERLVSELSGGELQAVYVSACLAKEADIYLLDEPLAFLDVEQRLRLGKIVKKVISLRNAVAFIVEHDIIMHDLIADRLIVFSGKPGVEGYASKPLKLDMGMNMFLKMIDVTFRRDKKTMRPRVNKPGSYLDRYQKSIGKYYYI